MSAHQRPSSGHQRWYQIAGVASAGQPGNRRKLIQLLPLFLLIPTPSHCLPCILIRALFSAPATYLLSVCI
ncbi:hypothetical protein B0H12DRAFT_1142067 [Mycena haematopus]|nr:hypothetical protein B0H12DRAFT_1142067 [Mycena haematopus]